MTKPKGSSYTRISKPVNDFRGVLQVVDIAFGYCKKLSREVPQDKQTDSELQTLLNEMHAMRERVHNVEEDMKEVKKQMISLVRGLHPPKYFTPYSGESKSESEISSLASHTHIEPESENLNILV